MRNAQQLQNITTQYASLSHYLRFFFYDSIFLRKTTSRRVALITKHTIYTLNLSSSFGKPGRTEPAKVNNTSGYTVDRVEISKEHFIDREEGLQTIRITLWCRSDQWSHVVDHHQAHTTYAMAKLFVNSIILSTLRLFSFILSGLQLRPSVPFPVFTPLLLMVHLCLHAIILTLVTPINRLQPAQTLQNQWLDH